MAKLHLLKTERDFDRFRRGRSYQSATLRIRIVPALDQNFARFGFIVPKKVLPKATDRNAIKRRFKAILAKHGPHLKSVDMLLFPAKLSLKQASAELETETIQLFQRAGIWKS